MATPKMDPAHVMWAKASAPEAKIEECEGIFRLSIIEITLYFERLVKGIDELVSEHAKKHMSNSTPLHHRLLITSLSGSYARIYDDLCQGWFQELPIMGTSCGKLPILFAYFRGMGIVCVTGLPIIERSWKSHWKENSDVFHERLVV